MSQKYGCEDRSAFKGTPAVNNKCVEVSRGGEESYMLKKRDEAGSHQADKNVLGGHSLTVCLIWEAFPRRHWKNTLLEPPHALGL